jgi:hypothetical protein
MAPRLPQPEELIMRLGLIVATVFAVLTPAAVTAAEPEKATVELRSDLLVSGLPVPGSEKPAYGLRLTARVDRKGEGNGTLELDLNAPVFDEFGLRRGGGSLAAIKLACTLKLVKKKKLLLAESSRIGAPLVEVEWVLFEIKGSMISRPLYLATEEKSARRWGRLLVHDKDGKVQYMVPMTTPPPLEPCHPGCFPAGTPIRTPDGSQRIERLREGDLVTTVGPDGAAAPGKVISVFCTRNRLVEVRTEAGKLATTETQRLALADRGLRAAGELKPGDRIFRWDGRERRAVMVRSVSYTGWEETVFNLIVGEPPLFVADGFLVRSKPPPSASPAQAEGLAPAVPPDRARD